MSDRPPPTIRLALHGPPRLGADERWIALERKAAGALAWLALRGPALRVRLAELLWPAAAPDGARNSLRQLIFKLKKALDAPVIEGQETLSLPGTLRLEAGDGELLEGCSFDDCPAFAEWLDEARAAHRHEVTSRRLQRADAALAAGDADEALELARALVAEDALSEAAHLRVVQALYLRGERSAALEAAERCEALLREALGAAPSLALERLVATVRRAQSAAAPEPIPVAVLRPPRLVGRSRELATLADARATGHVALVSGEPGLGKSRLLGEAAGAGDLILGARPGDTGVPFAALARWLRALHEALPAVLDPLPPALQRLVPELAVGTVGTAGTTGSVSAIGAVVSDGAPRLDLQAAVLQVWQRAAHAGLTGVCIDDLHFADEASVECLQGLLDDTVLAARAWVLARRPAEGGAALGRLADALLDDDRLLPVALAPLDEAGVHELVDSLGLPGLDAAALAPELWRRTGGNPMFVLETLKAMWLAPDRAQSLPRPRSVAALIERRLRQLSPGALALARVAALAGPDFDAPLAVHVLHTPPMALADAWAELESAQVLRDQAFAHDLIYEATLESVPGPIHRHVRRTIAEYLAPRNGQPARIAEHWLAAGEPAEAAPHFVAAGRQAEAAARYAEARQLFERAASCHDQAGQKTQAFDTRLALADLLMEAAQHSAAQAVLDAAVGSAATVEMRVRAGMQQMHLMSRDGRHPAAVELGQRLLADEDVLEDALPHRLAELRWTLAMLLVAQGLPGDALAQLQLAEPQLAESGDPSWRCWFHSQHAVASSLLGEVSRALESQARALEAARQVGRRRMLAGCLQNGAGFSTSAGHLVPALDLVDESTLLMADTGGDDHFSIHLRGQRARLLVWLGRYGEALELLESLTSADSPADAHTIVRSWLALAELWSRLAQPTRAHRALGEARRLAPSAVEQRIAALTACEMAWMHEADDAAEIRGFEALNHAGPYAAHAQLLQWRAQPQHLSAAQAAERCEGWAGQGLDGHVAVAHTLAARDAARAGQAQAAAALAGRAMAGLRKALLPNTYRPWLLLEIARAATPGDAELASKALREGRTGCRASRAFRSLRCCATRSSSATASTANCCRSPRQRTNGSITPGS